MSEIVLVMLCRRLCQTRLFLLILILLSLSLTVIHYLFKNHSFELFFRMNRNQTEKDNLLRIIEVNDRTPTFQLATGSNYQFPLERNRAQTELLLYLQLKEKCKSNSNTTVFDIGASLGEFGFYAAACGCRVFMFEVDPQKLVFIEQTIKLNSFQSRIHLIKRTVYDKHSNETVYFSRQSNQQLSPSTSFDRNDPDIYQGQTINLNQHEFQSLTSIYILKIDVQGHELHVLRSMEKFFQQNLISNLIFEYTPWIIDANLQKDIFNYLRDILHAKQFYALHPKQPIIFGPLNHFDLQQFYSQHLQQKLQRDVFALFYPNQLNITAEIFQFQSSF